MKCKKCGYEHEEEEKKGDEIAPDKLLKSESNNTSGQGDEVEEELFKDDEPSEGDNLGKAKKATLAAIIKKKMNVK